MKDDSDKVFLFGWSIVFILLVIALQNYWYEVVGYISCLSMLLNFFMKMRIEELNKKLYEKD